MSEDYKGWTEQQYIEKIKELEETIEHIIEEASEGGSYEIEFEESVKEIQKDLEKSGVSLPLKTVDKIWKKYSEDFYCAGFLVYDKSHIGKLVDFIETQSP